MNNHNGRTNLEPATDLNPWRSIWTKPRKTLRWLVDHRPRYGVLPLAVVGGISTAFNQAINKDLGDKMELFPLVALLLILGPLGGLASVYLGSLLLRWTGRILQGTGSVAELRLALAWSSAPAIPQVIILIILLVILGPGLFSSRVEDFVDASVTEGMTLLVLGIIQLIMGVWQMVLILACLSEVQRFSIWKAAGNIALSFAIVVVPLLAVAAGIPAIK